MKRKLVILSVLCVLVFSSTFNTYSATADTTQGIKIIKLMKNTTPGGGRT